MALRTVHRVFFYSSFVSPIDVSPILYVMSIYSRYCGVILVPASVICDKVFFNKLRYFPFVQVSYDHRSYDFNSAVQYMKHFIYHFTSLSLFARSSFSRIFHSRVSTSRVSTVSIVQLCFSLILTVQQWPFLC